MVILLSCIGQAATLSVGPGKPYSSPCAAIEAAEPGDVIEVDPGASWIDDACVITRPGLTLRSSGAKRASIGASGQTPLARGQALWTVAARGVTIDGFEFHGARAADGSRSAAAIRVEDGFGVTVRNCYLHENDSGLRTGDAPEAEVMIERTEFANNGGPDALMGNIEVGRAGRLTLRFSYSHQAGGGTLLRTQALENQVLYNRLSQEGGAGMGAVVLGEQAVSYVIGNLIRQGPEGGNGSLLLWLPETRSDGPAAPEIYVVNNTFVNEGSELAFVAATDRLPALIQNNIFYGPGVTTTQTSARLSQNFTGDPGFVNRAAGDYRLQATSAAINTGAQPDVVGGFSLRPEFQYVHPMCGEVRRELSVIDLGAFEFGASEGGRCGEGAEARPLPATIEKDAAKHAASSDASLPAVTGQVTLALSSASAAPGATVTLNLNMTSTGTLPAALQWTLRYPTGAFTSVQLTASSAAAGAGKQLNCTNDAVSTTCLLVGLNATTLTNGVVASAAFRLSSAPGSSPLAIQVENASSANEMGDTIPANTNGGTITVTGTTPPAPVPQAISCSPSTLSGAAGATCTVTLTSAALSGGSSVTLSDNSSHLTVPASVTVAAGATSASFTATASSVSSATTVQVTASLNGGTVSTTLSLAAVTVGVSPASASLSASQSTQFSATVSGTTNTAVTWSRSPSLGTISTSGLYTAPSSIASIQTVVVTATSVADPAKSASATVTLNPTVVVPPQGDLLAYWPLEEGSGSVTADLSGNNHHGAISGATWTSDCRIGKALAFNGNNQFVNAGSIDLPGNAFTVSAWVKPLSFDDDPRIISKATGRAEQDHYFMLSFYENRLRFRLKTADTTKTLIATSGGVTLGTWAHVAATYDGSTLRLYQDGIEVGSLAVSGSITAAPSVPLWIGMNPDGSAAFNGTIDQVRIYSRALTQPEVSSLDQGQTSVVALASFSCTPTTLAAGGTGTCTVALTEVAASAFAVAISHNSGYLTVPTSISVPQGAANATFTVVAGSPTATQSAAITVNAGGDSQSASLTIQPAVQPASLACSPASLSGAASATCTVTLTGAAPSGGSSVTLSDNSSYLTVPASVTVAAGATSASFTATASSVSSATTVQITATLNGGTATASLTLAAPATLASLSCAPTTLTAGASSTCTVALTAAATSAFPVTLSDNSTDLTVPSSISVPQGATNATFTALAGSPTTTQSAAITASADGVTRTASLTIQPTVQPASLACSPAALSGAASATCTVTLTSVAPSGGSSVTLSDNSNYLTVPASVTVAAGATSASFTATASAAPSATTVQITATLNGGTATASLTLAVPVALTSLSCAPTTLTAGASSTCTVALTAAATSAFAVTLSDDSSYLTVPTSISIPQGASSTTFTAMSGSSAATQSAAITASADGVTRSVSLTIQPAVRPATLACSPAALSGVASATCTVTLTGAAPSGGSAVTLSDNSSYLTVPASVTVAAGATSASFTATASAVPSSTTVQITATLNGGTATASLTLGAPVILASLSCAPTTLTAGASSTCTVALTAAATSAFAVTLSDNSSYLTVPTSISVPQGAASATFTAVAGSPSATQSAAITASADGVTRTASLTIEPTVRPATLTCSPTSLSGAASASCTVTLTGAAPSGGSSVTLSDNSSYVAVPASVTVTAGATSASFTATASAVSSATTVQITATLNGGTASTTLSCTAVTMSVSPASASLTASQSAQFSATVSGTTNTAVTWSRSPSLGTISTSGLYTAPSSIASIQTVVVTATSVADPAKSASATVTLNPTVVVPPQGGDLLAYWPLEEGSGSITADASGNNHLGVISGATWTSDARVGKALAFNGNNQFVNAGAFDLPGNAFTVSAWVKPLSFNDDPRIISKATGRAEQDHYFMLSFLENRLRFRLKTAGSTKTLIATSGGVALGTWAHVAATYDGSTLRLYQNGIEVGSLAVSGSITVAPSVPVRIGMNPDGSAAFSGTIDQVRIYNRALTQAEVSSLDQGQTSVVALASLSCTPTTVAARGTGICTVGLTAPATSAFAVTISDNSPYLTVPGIIYVPSGASSAVFAFVAGSPNSPKTATITAKAGGVSKTFQIQVQ